MLLERWPMIRPKLKYGDATLCQVLLMAKILIGDDEQSEAFGFCPIKQFAITDSAPSHFHRSRHRMIVKSLANLNWNRFVEENPHAAISCSIRC
ncbi:MAG TPA: hypothetical protein VFO22_05855 [Candidatus Udaeobacter sp.]|jgi:hypothetical protein|nr:hypothetical protein [Candidatus Udaeobacter sp.]